MNEKRCDDDLVCSECEGKGGNWIDEGKRFLPCYKCSDMFKAFQPDEASFTIPTLIIIGTALMFLVVVPLIFSN